MPRRSRKQVRAEATQASRPQTYEIDVTYRCNAACHWCNRLVGVMPIPDCDITMAEVAEAGRRVVAASVDVGLVKVSGGEPLLHPQLKEICDTIKATWKPRGRVRIFTNDLIQPRPQFGYRYWPAPIKAKQHLPVTISPKDLGIEATGPGWKWPCRAMYLCGHGFDCFGFGACPFQGIIGRVLGIDAYSPTPELLGMKAVCEHCIYSVDWRQRHVIEKDVLEGNIPDRSATYRCGIKAHNAQPLKLPRFLER